MLKRLKTWIFRKKIKAVIFDYDGVLNDSLDIIREMYNEFYRRGFTNIYFKDNQEFSNFFQGDTYANMESAGMELTKENKEKANAMVKEVLPSLDAKVGFFEGADDLLRKLESDGYKLGIVSNGDKDVISDKLRNYNVAYAVDTIIGFEQVSNPKPNPEGILKCLSDLGVKPKEALYVGDMESDIQAAKAAGVKVIGVTYGYYTLRSDKFEILKKADMLAHTIDEVYERIKNA